MEGKIPLIPIANMSEHDRKVWANVERTADAASGRMVKVVTTSGPPTAFAYVSEEGWLVERTAEPGCEWWTGEGWSRDANAAIRFARQVDAERAIRCLEIPDAFATGHMWCP